MIRVDAVPIADVSVSDLEVFEPLPLWSDLDANRFYDGAHVLLARRKRQIVGIWVVPSVLEGGSLHARRRHRLLPYCGPVLRSMDACARFEALDALARALTRMFDSVSLPLPPPLRDVGPFAFTGMLLETRVTYRHGQPWGGSAGVVTPTALNHIRSAARSVSLVAEPVALFDFARGIRSASSSEVDARRRTAIAMASKLGGVAFRALTEGQSVGGAVVLCDSETAYLMHTWFDRAGPRGVPSLLISTALDWSLRAAGRTYFDFEGSVLPGVARFFSSFAPSAQPYTFLHWNRDVDSLLRDVASAAFTPERLYADRVGAVTAGRALTDLADGQV